MVIKVYISGISGNKEVKKRQQRVLLILDSKNIKYELIDIAEPGAEDAKDFMQNNSTSLGVTIGDPSPRHPLPPQIFNDEVYCGDYDMFDMANEIDEMEKFLKLEPSEVPKSENIIKNGGLSNQASLEEKESETKDNEVPNEVVEDGKEENEESKEGAGDEKVENGGEEEEQQEEKAKSKEASPEKTDE